MPTVERREVGAVDDGRGGNQQVHRAHAPARRENAREQVPVRGCEARVRVGHCDSLQDGAQASALPVGVRRPGGAGFQLANHENRQAQLRLGVALEEGRRPSGPPTGLLAEQVDHE